MGYTLQYRGILKIEPELKTSQLKYLKQFLNTDKRQHPEWEQNEYFNKLHYTIDMELTEDFDGIRWTGAEKSCEVPAQINYIISQMKKECPDFKLKGKFIVVDPADDNRWEIHINEKGWAEESKTASKGEKIICPQCGTEFYHNETKGL